MATYYCNARWGSVCLPSATEQRRGSTKEAAAAKDPVSINPALMPSPAAKTKRVEIKSASAALNTDSKNNGRGASVNAQELWAAPKQGHCAVSSHDAQRGTDSVTERSEDDGAGTGQSEASMKAVASNANREAEGSGEGEGEGTIARVKRKTAEDLATSTVQVVI